MAKTIITNLHDMVSSTATAYIYTNKEKFKSNTPGPQGLRGIPGADGTDGVGVTITSVLSNINKSLTINFSDGTQHTTDPLKGEDGRSVTITNVVNNANGTMLINFSDGTSHHTADLRGPQGPKGNTGDHVHHISYQRSKDSLGNEIGPVTPSQKGNTDTYAMWISQEELPEMYIGEFTVYNGLNTLTAEEQVKFDSIELGATRDQTGAEIKALYEAELDTNAYTDASVIKLDVDTALSTTATTLPTAINELVSVKVDTIVGSSLVPDTKVSLYDSHIIDTSNPHVVTKAQVGLSNADNTSDSIKNVLSATKWTAARTITLSGDVAGSASVDGSANVTITTTVQPNSVALGTDTTGNYMVNVTAGSGISVSHTQGEGSTATITNSAQNVTTDITTTHNSTNVVVNSSDGTDGTINSATQTLAGVMSADDKTKLDGIEVGATGDQTANEILTSLKTVDGSGSGLDADLLDGQEGAYYLDASNINAGTIDDDRLPDTITSSITGNSGTATKLATARTINGVNFDGSADITISDNTKLTKINPVITGSITEQVYNLTGTEINPTNGTIQYKTVSSNTTFTETLAAGQSVILRLIDASNYTITFPTITWVGAVAPTLTANCAIVLWKEQSTLYGSFVGTLV